MKSTYISRWGHKRTPKPMTHPKRAARRQGAVDRQARRAIRLAKEAA